MRSRAALYHDRDHAVARERQALDRDRKAHRAPRASDSRYRGGVDDLPLMVFQLDGNGTVVAVNGYGARELGYRSDELIGRPVFGVIHERDVPDLEQQLARALEHPGEILRWELRKVRKDGSELWVRETVRVVYAANGSPEILVVCEDATERRRAMRRLAETRDRLRVLNAELCRVAEREDQRIARILHDDVGHSLAATRMAICELRDSEPASDRSRRLDELRQMIDESIAATRSLASRLNPPILYELGLVRALRVLGERLEQDHGMVFRLEVEEGWPPPPQEIGVVLYKVARELCHNVVKHARANAVRLELNTFRGRIRLIVEDDGVGFEPQAVAAGNGLGLFQVRERLDWVGGELEIDATPRRGTRLELWVPIAERTRQPSRGGSP